MEDKELIALKAKTISQLQCVDVYAFGLDKADKRLNSYIIGCISNPDAHNLYELLSIHRFFYLFKRYDFRNGEVRKFVVCYESLKFSGTKGKTRYKLTPIQVFQFYLPILFLNNFLLNSHHLQGRSMKQRYSKVLHLLQEIYQVQEHMILSILN